MKINLSDILYGKITFSVKNGFCDLFLAECRKSGIPLFDIIKTDEGLKGFVRQKDLKALMKVCEKSGMELSVLSRKGLPNMFFRYRRRLGVPIGVLLFFCIIWVLSSMIWSVEITGLQKIPEETVVSLLEATGISKGVFSESLQCDDVEFFLANNLQELSWVSVYVAGSRVFVDIRERVDETEITDAKNYSNIIAAKDGEVIRADIYEGEGKIYPGTPVIKGDMLVNGVVTFTDGSVKFVNSEADIWARTQNHISSSSAMNITAEKTVVCKDRYSLYFFGIKIPFGKSDKAENFTESKYFFESADIVFPLGVIRENFYELTPNQIEISDIKAALIAFSDFSKASMKLYGEAKILERDIKMYYSSQISIEAKYLCEENIALEKSFTVNSEAESNQS
ncbi:MAG: sporulation protein YqfD [Clostridia bacterium]|nr:sporulation protein YqfD [Clostridia bacterium]